MYVLDRHIFLQNSNNLFVYKFFFHMVTSHYRKSVFGFDFLFKRQIKLKMKKEIHKLEISTKQQNTLLLTRITLHDFPLIIYRVQQKQNSSFIIISSTTLHKNYPPPLLISRIRRCILLKGIQ